jgi:flagellar hook-associated protein 1 FlgK
VQKASAVTDVFHQLDDGFQGVATSLRSSTDSDVSQINALTARIATLNGQIQTVVTGGSSAADLMDTRDQLITQLGQLINVTVYQGDYGVVSVSCSGTLLVDRNLSSSLKTTEEDGKTYVSVVGSVGQRIAVSEGQLAGILEMANDVLPGCQSSLDQLADGFRRAVNLVHTTGVGANGSFQSLEGTNALLGSQPLSELGYGVPAGTNEKLVINVTDQATGDLTQYELTLDTTQSADAFVASLRDEINANVGHVTASVDQGKLSLQADSGYTFDFATPYDPNPAQPGDITAANPTSPGILDAYTGNSDLQYDVTFLNGGQIGTDPITIQIQARDPGGPVLRTLTRQIDATYVPGDTIELESGLKLTLSAGNVAAGDTFSFVAHASMDTAGVLDALGLNTLFDGLGAGLIEVTPRVYNDSSNLAAALRPMAGDNHRLLDLSALRSEKSMASGTATLDEYYRGMVSQIATAQSTQSVAQTNEDQLVNDLQDRRDSVSGVSVDEEMTKIMESRTLYQGALKYISTISDLMNDLFNLV